MPKMANSFPEEVLEHVFSFIQTDQDRNSISTVCKSWYEIERWCRRRIFIGNCYAVSPRMVIRRFPDIRSIELKGKPHFADFNLVPDGKLRYLGGETRVLAVPRSISFSELSSKLTELCGPSVTAVSLRCQLPIEDLDALVSTKSDEDLVNLIEEYDRAASSANMKIRAFQTLSDRLFKDTPWPSVDAVADYVDNDHVFRLLYREMWFRHLYTRLSPTLKQRIDSWDNYCSLFQVVLHGVVNMQLPNLQQLHLQGNSFSGADLSVAFPASQGKR
ncbi:uncharacterized protein LOC125479311 [Pyrus x bretschneideri]|uniref:uncharacterized protein LOC125479311 n=1 Tax=Pyrus x bretschneideri TaxID=225117 RepID=UPI0020306D7A|nr:uncharacterized protein LOC125479311 [Pyrus x bretschneideri]